MRLVQSVSVAHDIELINDNRQSLLSCGVASHIVTIDMEAGQTALIHFYTIADDVTGIIPAASFRLSTSFAEGEIELLFEPEPKPV